MISVTSTYWYLFVCIDRKQSLYFSTSAYTLLSPDSIGYVVVDIARVMCILGVGRTKGGSNEG